MYRSEISAMVALLAVFCAGCGQDFDRQAAVDSFVVANPDVTSAQAGCVVDRQIERYGIDGLAAELEAEPAEEAFVEEQFRDMFACGIDGDIEDQLVEQLEANGVEAVDAPCVADRIVDELGDEDIDVLVSGEITEDFMAKFVAAMEACGAEGFDESGG